MGEEAEDTSSELTTTISFRSGALPNSLYKGTTDTWLSEGNPSGNYGTSPIVQVDGDYPNGTGNDVVGLIRWDISAVPASATVRKVTLTVNITNAGPAYAIYEAKRGWSESQATWNNAGTGSPWAMAGARGTTDRGSTVLGTISSTANGAHSLTLNASGVAVVQRWVKDPSTNFGFVIADTALSDGEAFSSREATTISQRPKLSIDYEASATDGGAITDASTGMDGGAVVDAAPPPSGDAAAPVDSGSTTHGSGPPLGDLPGWHQIFVEDFSRAVPLGGFMADSYYGPRFKHTYPYPWKDTSKNGTYDPAKTLSVQNGLLDIDLHTEGSEICVAAVEPTLPLATRGQIYGRYAVRFRADAVAGYKTAWLLWPDSNLRSEGEIDFPEGNLDSTIKAYMHYASNDGTANSLGLQDAFKSTATYPSWHTAVIEWRPNEVKFYLDGGLLGTSTTKVPSRLMHWVIQNETALSGALPSATAHAHVSVDWVAAWSYTP